VKRRIHRRPQALSDVEESAVYIGLDSPVIALRFIEAVEETLRLLVKNPEIGPPRTFSRNELIGLRVFPVKGFDKHLVFYLPTEEGIEVMRILHGARDLKALFDE
jgi:toxin ParE1/3/4